MKRHGKIGAAVFLLMTGTLYSIFSNERICRDSVEDDMSKSAKHSPPVHDNATRCFLDLQKQLNDHEIDKWIKADVPIVEKVFRLERVWIILLDVEHLHHETIKGGRHKNFWLADGGVQWYWQNGNNTSLACVTNALTDDPHVSVLSCPNPNNDNDRSANPILWAMNATPTAHVDTHKKPLVTYNLTKFHACEALETKAWHQRRNPQNVSLGACTMWRDVSPLQIHEWIAYHRMIGVERFWLYQNEPFWSQRKKRRQNKNDAFLWASLALMDDVTMIPYYNFHHRRVKNSPPNHPSNFSFWQEPMQFQCLYRAKKYQVDWIITTDLDEFIWVGNSNNQPATRQSRPLLRELLHELEMTHPNIKDVGAFEMNSIPYRRNVHFDPPQHLPLDYTWRTAQPLDARERDGVKLIYQVEVARAIGRHELWKGGKTFQLQPSTQAHVRRFKETTAPIPNDLIRDSELFDAYHIPVLEELQNQTSIAYNENEISRVQRQ